MLLDEMLASRLAWALGAMGHDVSSFPFDWKGTKNGELLRRMVENGFDCLITGDKRLIYQQSVIGGSLGILVFPTSRFADLVPHLPMISRTLAELRPGTIYVHPIDGAVGDVIARPTER